MIVWIAFVAIAFPALGPLPWFATGYQRDATAMDARSHAREAAGRHADASAIPGSPTHPEDHDCAECKVLKHLSRCVSCAPAVAFAPAPTAQAAPLFVSTPLPRTRLAALLPRVRAPPYPA